MAPECEYSASQTVEPRDACETTLARAADLAGHAYQQLGFLATVKNERAEAIDLYKESIDLVSPYYEAQFSTWLGNLYCESGDLDAAIAEYSDAIDKAREYGYRVAVEEYWRRRDELKHNGCP